MLPIHSADVGAPQPSGVDAHTLPPPNNSLLGPRPCEAPCSYTGPRFYLNTRAPPGGMGHRGHPKLLSWQTHRAPVQDILLWTECFTPWWPSWDPHMYPHIADFMAYQWSIVRTSCTFEGNAWVVYNRRYRRWAAITRNLNRSARYTTLYNEASPEEHVSSPTMGIVSARTTPRLNPDIPQGQLPPDLGAAN